MAKLHQFLAVEADVRRRTENEVTELHKLLQKEPLFSGLHRTYEPIKDVKDGGVMHPAERTHLQNRASDAIAQAAALWKDSLDMAATVNWGNVGAKADVVVNGVVMFKDAPVTYLLWLTHQLDNMHTFVQKLPTLAPDIEWDWDKNNRCYKNRHEIKTTKGEKIAYAFVKFKGDEKHPPQVDKEFRDEVVGYWTAMKYSGAITVQEQKVMLERVEALRKAVKMAKEKANQVEAEDIKVSGPMLDFIFADVVKANKG